MSYEHPPARSSSISKSKDFLSLNQLIIFLTSPITSGPIPSPGSKSIFLCMLSLFLSRLLIALSLKKSDQMDIFEKNLKKEKPWIFND